MQSLLIGGQSGSIKIKEYVLEDSILLLGSDGFTDFIEAINKGLIEEYNDLNEFTEDSRNFSNPVFLPKLLQKYSNLEVLKDDCSIMMVKHR